MAGDERSSLSSDPKKARKSCVHCKKDVVTSVQCVKCKLLFHPACLKQAAIQKIALCAHKTENEDGETSNDQKLAVEDELAILKIVVENMTLKIKSLEENEAILRRKIFILEEKMIEVEKKGKQKLPPNKNVNNAGQDSTKCGNTARRPIETGAMKKVTPAQGQLKQGRDGSSVPSSNTTEYQNGITVNNSSNAQIPVNTKNSTDAEDDVFIGKVATTASHFQNKAGKNDFQKENLIQTQKENVDKNKLSERNPETDKEDDADWILVKTKSGRKNYPKQPRPAPIRGTNIHFGMEVAKPAKSYLFLSGLNPGATEEQLQKHLKDTLNVTCKAYKMKTRKDNFKSSFKLEVPAEMRDTVMSPEIWGKGVIINFFLHLRRRPILRENLMENLRRT